MRLDKMTVKLQEAIQEAISLAAGSGHQQVEPEHLLLALLRQEESIIVSTLDKLGIRDFRFIKVLEED
ncbi:MAG: Clp protease N-terminal domain-containing protein, partial [Candidatus Omnitrophica bacterium]|nr:Clp protease N-terminal domain-containing protein [Candidatus Omnitrophota bacterium]